MDDSFKRSAFGLKLRSYEEGMSFELESSSLTFLGAGDYFQQGSVEDLLVIRV